MVKIEPVIGAGDDTFAVESDTSDQLFVPLKHSQTRPDFNIPQPAITS